MTNLLNFSKRLKEYLDYSNMTPYNLEDATGLNNSNIYMWLRNQALPNLNSLVILSNYMKCTIEFLCGRISENYYIQSKSVATFNQRLSMLIENKKLTVSEFLVQAKIPKSSYYHWLNGKRIPFLDKLVQLADFFDCTIDFLVGRE